jgi:hypothetical protein
MYDKAAGETQHIFSSGRITFNESLTFFGHAHGFKAENKLEGLLSRVCCCSISKSRLAALFYIKGYKDFYSHAMHVSGCEYNLEHKCSHCSS